MKKCKNCGAVQENDNTVCVDCGCVLGAPVSADEAEALDEEISASVDGMSARCEDFYVSVKDRIIGFVSIALAVASIVMIVIAANTLNRIDQALGDEGYIIVDGVAMNRPANSLAVMDDHFRIAVTLFMGSLLFSVWSAVGFLFPKLVWWLDTRRLRWISNIDPEPSAMYLFTYKVAKYFVFAVAFVCFAVAVAYMLK